MDIAFQADQLTCRYDRVVALDQLSVTIPRGQRVALLGANGSGKSTLLRILAGLQFPQSGEVRFFGDPLTEASLNQEEFFFRFRGQVGVIFQNPDVQLFNPTVLDEVAFAPLQLHWPKDKIRRRIYDSMELLGVTHLADRAPHRLSGGEKKRVALASVLVLDPEILLLDEPLAALDPQSQRAINGFLSSWGNGKKTIVTATHDLDTLEEIADHCYILGNGKVAGQGKPLQILHDVALLEATGLVRLHPHTHTHDEAAQPHPHLHRQ